MGRRHAFRPDALGPLEDRVVLSRIAPSLVGRAAPVKRFTIQTPTITQSTPQWSHRPLPGGQYPSSLTTRMVILPGDGANPGVRTVEVHIENAGNAPVSSAAMTQRLPRNVAYVDGSARPVDGGGVSATKARNGTTVIEWTIPGPVASEELVATFQVKPGTR
jgi:hypothetical protein